ncbi:MAG: AMP-binding protein [Acidimicrobiales bacterium]
MEPDLSGVDPLAYNLATRVSVGDALTRSASMFPDRAAVIDRGAVVSYRELDDAAEAVGASLLDLGLAAHEPVALLTGNSWRTLATYFACAKSGLVAMPINVQLSPADIAWILTDAGARLVVVDVALTPILATLGDVLEELRIVVVGEGASAPGLVGALAWSDLAARHDGSRVEVVIEDRDVVQCLYTSGTTSRPKGVLVSHLSVFVAGMTDALAMEHRWGSTWSVLVNVLPLFHTTALNTLCLPVLFTGGTVVLPGPFDPATVLDTIERERATHLMALPMMWSALVEEQDRAPRDVTSVVRAVYAMAPMSRELLDRVDAAFPHATVILGSGQTEVVPATVLQWPEHRWSAPESWGPSVPSVLTRCLDAEGHVLGPDAVGEIAYRGPHVASGYWNNRDANAAAFAHGWFHSGDLGRVDAEGVVWFTDRLKDVIKSGGENVSSVDVERVVSTAPGVRECSIVGVPDPYWGEAVCAVVVPDGTVALDELAARVIAYAKERLAGFQVPKSVVAVDELPRTATGKVRKHDLRDRLRDVGPDRS